MYGGRMDVLRFMSDSPILTFFLALVVGDVVVGSVRAITRTPEHCDGCRCGDDVNKEEG